MERLCKYVDKRPEAFSKHSSHRQLTIIQDSNTADMIFGVRKAVSFLSQGTTLVPGDVIFMGT